MTRWHDPSCETPDVEVESNTILKCKACGRSCPPVEELISERADTSSALQIPLDEPLGQMNLWWPESVPYERGGVQTYGSRRPSNKQDARPDTLPDIASSHIYQDALRSDEFRLACLSAVSDKEAPIHVTLEVFPDNDHPEYECASYAWGGEDGDSTPCRPIYIGLYWDVLLQTKNCSSLLRFLRPWRGTRMVWVDAICINQESLAERATQVAKMKSLYERCFRVVVYLGDDMITCSNRFPKSRSLGTLQNEEHPFPRNHPLRESQFDLKEILSRRYFSRLWVIQELVASRRAVIRIGDVDYNADAGIIAKEFLANNGVFSPAPWFQYLGHGSIPGKSIDDVLSDGARSTSAGSLRLTATNYSDEPVEDRERPSTQNSEAEAIGGMLYVLKITAQSQASDPRDRLFGVISLLSDPNVQRDLAPDYEISYQQFLIGFFAYLLLVGGRSWFLWNAGIVEDLHTTNDSSIPSWVPQCRSSGFWRYILETETRKKWNHPQIEEPWFCGRVPHMKSFGKHIREYDSSWLFTEVSDYADDAIDPTSGALIITVTHLFSLRDGISLQGAHGPMHVYSIPVQIEGNIWKPSSLVLLSMGSLDIQPENDHIFIPNRLADTYFILRRQLHETPGHPSFRLITTRIRLLETDRPCGIHLEGLLNQEYQSSERWSELWPLSREALMPKIRASVAAALTALQEELQQQAGARYGEIHAGTDWTFRFCYFFLRRPRPDSSSSEEKDRLYANIIRLWAALSQDLNMKRGYAASTETSIAAVREVFLGSINPRFQAKAVLDQTQEESMIILAVPYDEWFRFHESIRSTFPRSRNKYYTDLLLRWKWSYEGERRWHKPRELPDSENRDLSRNLPERIVICMHLNDFFDQVRAHTGCVPEVLHQLVHAYKPPLEVSEVIQMVINGPTEEQQRIGLPKYLGEVLVDGSQYKIRII